MNTKSRSSKFLQSWNGETRRTAEHEIEGFSHLIIESLNQCLNDSMTNCLPFSGFHQFADFALHQVALQPTEMTDIELAVEVIGFVKKGASQEFLTRFLVKLTIDVLSANRDLIWPRYIFTEVRNAQTSFALSVFAFGMNNLRVDQDQFGVRILFEGYVDDRDAAADTNLRRRETHAVGFVHRFKHIVDELLEFAIEGGYFLCGLLKNRVAEFYDRIDHQ